MANDVRAARVKVGGRSDVLLSVPKRGTKLADALTPAERQVALAVLDGRSNAEVAQMRGSSPRTIANQLARIYKKLGVSSRTELAAALTGALPLVHESWSSSAITFVASPAATHRTTAVSRTDSRGTARAGSGTGSSTYVRSPSSK